MGLGYLIFSERFAKRLPGIYLFTQSSKRNIYAERNSVASGMSIESVGFKRRGIDTLPIKGRFGVAAAPPDPTGSPGTDRVFYYRSKIGMGVVWALFRAFAFSIIWIS